MKTPPPDQSPDSARTGVRKVTIDDGHAGQRIDNFLLTELKGAPRSLVYRILRSGEVRRNGGRVQASDRLELGDVIRIPPLRLAAENVAPTVNDSLKGKIEASVVYEDDHLLVINKPAGMAVHGGSGISLGVIETFRQLRPDGRFLELVHRLDRETSGCLVLAKSRAALLKMQAQLHVDEDEGMDKVYIALLRGRWQGRHHRIEAPLLKNVLASGERVVRVSREGKASITEFAVTERFVNTTLVEATLLTGRTHQIRVHALHAGHPIAGDEKYGDPVFNRDMKGEGLRRMFLHAARLRFNHPVDGRDMRIEAPLEKGLKDVIEKLRVQARDAG